MHIVWGVLAGIVLGAVVGVVVFFWQMERADGNLLPY